MAGSWHFVQQKNTTMLLSACFVPDFTYEFIQRSGLREPIIFEKPDGLGIKYLFSLLLMYLMCKSDSERHMEKPNSDKMEILVMDWRKT